MKSLKSKFYKALFFLLTILSIGVVGYMTLSDFDFIDALYMTVITISTVGFRELHPMNTEEKVFTIFLILTSLSLFGYAVSSFTEALANGEFFKQLKRKKVQQKIDKLKQHTIVCGYGRNGMQAINKLRSYQQKFVVVEKDKELISSLEEDGILYIEGDATTDEVLLKAGIENANYLITALPSDADNLFVVLTASQLSKDCKIISRASNESSNSKLKIAGASNVIMPDKLGGAHMASLVVTPDVIEFVDRLTIEGETTATGCTVIGFKTSDGNYVINPEASIKLVADSRLIVLGKPEQIVKLRKLF
jgi:voltage-gated potassium channel